MHNLVRLVGQILLSVPWFLKWPFAVWNWAARAHHVPAEERQPLFSQCFGGFGIILMCAFAILLAPEVRVFLSFFAPYIGAGIPTVLTGIRLSRKYRHLRETKLLEYKPTT